MLLINDITLITGTARNWIHASRSGSTAHAGQTSPGASCRIGRHLLDEPPKYAEADEIVLHVLQRLQQRLQRVEAGYRESGQQDALVRAGLSAMLDHPRPT